MESAREELESLISEDQTNPNGTSPSSNELNVKDQVMTALNEYTQNQMQEQERAQQEERQKALEAKNMQNKRELEEISNSVIQSIKEEAEKDKDFQKMVEGTDIPGKVIESIAEVGDAEEAPLIVKELANNETYRNQFKNAKTELGRKRIIAKVRKDVLTGGFQGKIPEITRQSIPNYNQNAEAVAFDDNYYDQLAISQGIAN